MPFARQPIHQRLFDISCLISFVRPGKSQDECDLDTMSPFQWQNGDPVEPGWAWEVDVVIPGFQTGNAGTQLEWICSCVAFGNNNGSRAEGWSK